MTNETQTAAPVSLEARLQQTARDLTEHRQTHVVWRDWLQKDPANAAVNPHAGTAEFHAGVILDYDRHLANIEEAIDALNKASACRCAHGYTCGACDDTSDALATLRLAQSGAVACYRVTDRTGGPWGWVDGPASDEVRGICEQEGWRIEYAYTHPAAVAVDDAMVERAMTALSMDGTASLEYAMDCMDYSRGDAREIVRAALEAALQPAPSENES